MNETFKYLTEKSKVYYLATIENGRPSCRPFGSLALYDNKLYIITNKQKEVSKQIEKNNNICIVGYDQTTNEWMRVYCELIDDSSNIEAKKIFLNQFSTLTHLGYSLENSNFQILYLKNASTSILDVAGNVITTYNF